MDRAHQLAFRNYDEADADFSAPRSVVLSRPDRERIAPAEGADRQLVASTEKGYRTQEQGPGRVTQGSLARLAAGFSGIAAGVGDTLGGRWAGGEGERGGGDH